jgi:hypothetical protein
MLLEALHDVFTVIKFFFGLGALAGLLAIGLAFLWFLGRVGVRWVLRGQPAERYVTMRKLFLER